MLMRLCKCVATTCAGALLAMYGHADGKAHVIAYGVILAAVGICEGVCAVLKIEGPW
jgi:hypothetical protein